MPAVTGTRRQQRTRRVGLYLVLVAFGVVMLFPFAVVAGAALKDTQDIFRYPPRLLPYRQQTVEVDGEAAPLYRIDGVERALVGEVDIGIYAPPDDLGATVRVPIGDVEPTGGFTDQESVVIDGEEERLFDVPVEGQVVAMVEVDRTVEGRFALPDDPTDVVSAAIRTAPTVDSVSARTENFGEVLAQQNLARSLTNTVLVTLLVVGGTVLTSILGGYAFARVPFRGRDGLFLVYIGSIMVPFVILIIPLYQLMVALGWVDSLAALVFPFIFNAYGTFLMRQFFVSIPRDLEEAAVLDGASRWTVLWRIFVPLSMPAIATLSTFMFLYAWNSFVWPFIVINAGNLDNHVLTLSLQQLGGRAADSPNLVFAAVVLAVAVADHGLRPRPALLRRERRELRHQVTRPTTQSERPMARRLIACALALAALVPLAPAARSQAPLPGTDASVDLAGTWRFTTGDDPAWSDPGFDDSGWEEAMVPEEGGQPVFADYDGFAWFRRTFAVPEEAAGVPFVLALGGIDDADETFLNGQLIGATGSFPPDEDSQWFERRLYPVPAGAIVPGAVNSIAVRMNDFTGGGGWYQGPVGLLTKERLREEVYGLFTEPAPEGLVAPVVTTLQTQAEALAAGDLDAYLATLDPAYFHDGDTLDRRGREIAALLASHGSLEVRDDAVEVLVADDGRLVVDTSRALLAGETVVRPTTQEFLVFDPLTGLEVGNRSRFFRDSVDSALEGAPREYVVYLPPSYLTHPEQRFPVVYLLHGINGGAREWEPRSIDRRLDALIRDEGIAESIVVMPDGESLWYVDSSAAPWRSMFTSELLPQVDAEYRTLAQREFRALTGVSMGGHGAFTIGWAHPDLFSSIGSHMGALDFPPLAGSPEEVAANADETPIVQVTGHTPEFLSGYDYFFDACEEDDFRFDDAARAMDGHLTGKLVEHTWAVYPEGRHNDDCWVPHLVDSFGVHSAHFRAAGLVEPVAVADVRARGRSGPG